MSHPSHKLLTPAECMSRDPDSYAHDRGLCNICDGGLAFCVRCKGGECELDTPCVPIRPLNDRMLVERTEPVKVTQAGIIIPDRSVNETGRAIVLRLGPGKLNSDGTRQEFQCAVGDVVVFNKYGGIPIEYEGKEYLIMPQNEVLAVEVTLS